ncbi:RNA binding protein, heterogenous nuclear RNP-K like protein [Coemansia sp. Benny D115]|nr:RNA binding protein, heterogenous nuclear RNP-K like protein [Coemansia sp. Benny D115]
MSDGPKRFSLSDYQSKRGAAKPAATEPTVPGGQEQKSELEELRMLIGQGVDGNEGGSAVDMMVDEDPGILRTPGASPKHSTVAEDAHEDGAHDERGSGNDRAAKSSGSRRDDKRGRDRKRRHRRSSRRSRSRSRSPSSSRRRRSRSHSRSRSRSRSRSQSRGNDRDSRSQSRAERSRGSRKRNGHKDRSVSCDKISMRCVFPYEDGGIIIGLRGAHLTKLRKSVPSVDWRISNETNDKQDRILVVRGSVRDVAEAFKELAEHFISQGMHVDYPTQTRGRGSKEVDTSKPFIPIRLLMPHKTCGAIIGQRSETLINTRINCAARRVYVYRERISESRERVVEIVGTPRSICKVMEVLGDQVARTLTNDQHESDPYVPERDGLRKFLGKQGVPRTRVHLETIKSVGESKDKRGRSVSSDRSSDRSRSRGRHGKSSRRSRRRSHSPDGRSHRSSRRSRRSHKSRSSRHGRSRSRSRSRSSSMSVSRSRSRSRRRSRSQSRSRSRGRDSRRKKQSGAGKRRSGTKKHRQHGEAAAGDAAAGRVTDGANGEAAADSAKVSNAERRRHLDSWDDESKVDAAMDDILDQGLENGGTW